jgi:hypothetical protein
MPASTLEAGTGRAELAAAVAELLREPVASLEPVGGGRNSRVCLVAGASGRRVIAKWYFRHPLDGRDRMRVEVSALRFLRAQGLANVPEPLGEDPARRVAIFECVEGDGIGAPTDADVGEAVAFLAALRALRERPGARAFGPASEAGASLAALVETIERRLRWLHAGGAADAAGELMQRFVAERFVPALERVTRWCRAQAGRRGVAYEQPLPLAEQTLSPSDFGFHNALRCRGRLVFLDFEYFGWDDPAKLAADFILHPAMRLSEGLKRRFIAGFVSRFEPRLERRLPLVYPLCGLKWCAIFLNEFVPQFRKRRAFAGADADGDEIRLEQLSKAERMLGRVLDEHEQFPYSR